jgi:hypothetical protein
MASGERAIMRNVRNINGQWLFMVGLFAAACFDSVLNLIVSRTVSDKGTGAEGELETDTDSMTVEIESTDTEVDNDTGVDTGADTNSGDTDVDSGADTDVDSDADTDGDSDTDTDADTDTDTGPVPLGCSSVIEFPDQELEAAVRSAIGKPDGDIYYVDIDDLTELSATGYNSISELTGIQCLTGLSSGSRTKSVWGLRGGVGSVEIRRIGLRYALRSVVLEGRNGHQNR